MDLHITLTRKQTKDIKSQPEKYRFLSTTSTFDFIDEHNPEYVLHFRVVRFKLDGSEEYESIIKKISRAEFSKDEIKERVRKKVFLCDKQKNGDTSLSLFYPAL